MGEEKPLTYRTGPRYALFHESRRGIRRALEPALDHAAPTFYLHTSAGPRMAMHTARWIPRAGKKMFRMKTHDDKSLKTNGK
jgi:hypothetical protein